MSIILKRGTEANRSGLSLKTGEPIFTTDTRRLYIGSGSSSAGNEIEFGQLSASFVSASTVSATNVTVDTLTAKNPINTTCSYSQTASYLLGSVESASYVDYANVGNKPSLVSSSAQIDYAGIQNKPTTIATASYVAFANVANKPSLVSSSAQVLNGSNVYSSSAQLPSGIVSASSQIDYTQIQNKPTTIATASYVLNAVSASYAPTKAGVVSSSAQIDYTQIQNKPTTIATASYVTFANVANKPSLVSSSLQFDNADNVTFGQITASRMTINTLVVQTITSSAEYVTGSTIHGSTLANTHQFTGSVNVTGSMSVMGGNVGIGTAAPNERFTVGGSGTFGMGFQQDSTTIAAIKPNTITGEVRHFATTNYFPTFYANGAERMRIDANGNVGINNTNPLRKLDVVGDSNGNGIRVTGPAGTIGSFTAEGTSVNIQADSAAATRVLVDAGSSNASGFVVLNGGSSGYVQLGTGGTARMQVFASGVVKLNNYGAGTLQTDAAGNITANASPTVTNLNATGTVTVNSGGSPAGTVRNITISTAAPSGGADGDVWLQYTA